MQAGSPRSPLSARSRSLRAGPMTTRAPRSTSSSSAAAPAGDRRRSAAARSTPPAPRPRRTPSASGRRASSRPNSGVEHQLQPSGSGAGVQAFIQGTVAFAGSDSALKTEEGEPARPTPAARPARRSTCRWSTARSRSSTTCRASTACSSRRRPSRGIFDSKITDGTTRRSRPTTRTPSSRRPPIQAFHRSDDSGTTDNFTKFLMPPRRTTGSTRAAKTWPAEAGPGRQGLRRRRHRRQAAPTARSATSSSPTPTNCKLQTAKVDNGAGEFVELTPESAAQDRRGAEVTGTGNDLALKIDYAPRPGRLPDRPGDLRDRLREGPARRGGASS